MAFKADHFYKQFDRYKEGQDRFEAVARHAAMLLNSLEEQKAEEVDTLIRIRDALANGVNTAKIALAIQSHLEDKFDTGADCPSLGDLAA